jgi:hypothetical protein
LPSWIRILNPDPDPLTRLNPDPIRIRIRIPDQNHYVPRHINNGYINSYIQVKNDDLFPVQAQQVALVEKLIAGKLVKQAFIDQGCQALGLLDPFRSLQSALYSRFRFL